MSTHALSQSSSVGGSRPRLRDATMGPQRPKAGQQRRRLSVFLGELRRSAAERTLSSRVASRRHGTQDTMMRRGGGARSIAAARTQETMRRDRGVLGSSPHLAIQRSARSPATSAAPPAPLRIAATPRTHVREVPCARASTRRPDERAHDQPGAVRSYHALHCRSARSRSPRRSSRSKTARNGRSPVISDRAKVAT